jgi:hypothetical protein
MSRKWFSPATIVVILVTCISGPVAANDPISAVGHGAISDAQGREIDPSPGFVIGAQRYYLKRLYQQANDQQRTEFEAKQRHLQDVKGQTEAEQIVVNSALIDWLIDAVNPQDAAHLASKNIALLSRFAGITDGELSTKRPEAGEIREDLLELIKREGLLTFLSATEARGPDYIAECRQAGVPIPPDWGSPAWQSRGMLAIEFISKDLDAELFAFESESPRGVCFALPRSCPNTATPPPNCIDEQGNAKPAGTIILLGIICLGTEASKSCFWDNQSKKLQFDITGPRPLSDFAGGLTFTKARGAFARTVTRGRTHLSCILTSRWT